MWPILCWWDVKPYSINQLIVTVRYINSRLPYHTIIWCYTCRLFIAEAILVQAQYIFSSGLVGCLLLCYQLDWYEVSVRRCICTLQVDWLVHGCKWHWREIIFTVGSDVPMLAFVCVCSRGTLNGRSVRLERRVLMSTDSTETARVVTLSWLNVTVLTDAVHVFSSVRH